MYHGARARWRRCPHPRLRVLQAGERCRDGAGVATMPASPPGCGAGMGDGREGWVLGSRSRQRFRPCPSPAGSAVKSACGERWDAAGRRRGHGAMPITGWDVPGDPDAPPHGCQLPGAHAGSQHATAHPRDPGVWLAHACARRAHACRRPVGSGDGASWMDTVGGSQPLGGHTGPPPIATRLGLCAVPRSPWAGVPRPLRVLGMGTSWQGWDWETPGDWGPPSAHQ